MSKTIGNLKKITVDMTVPMKFKGELEHKSFSLYVGPNGSGKTLILKFTWVLSHITSAAVLQPKNLASVKIYAQYVFDKSFDEQNFTGVFNTLFERGELDITLVDGKVTELELRIEDTVTEPTPPILMSKDMRTFDQIAIYLKVRKKIGILGKPNQYQFEELLDFYKLYDVCYVEAILIKFKNKVKVSKEYKESINGFFELKIDEIFYDKATNAFKYTTDEGEEKNFTSLSAGEQAVCNMFLIAQ